MDGGVLGFVPGLDDDLLLVEGVFVGRLLPECDALDEAVEGYCTGQLGDGDGVVCVPLADAVSLGDVGSVLLEELGTVGDVVLGEGDAGVDVDDAHLGCTADYDLEVAVVLVLGDCPELLELQASVIAGYDLGLGGDA